MLPAVVYTNGGVHVCSWRVHQGAAAGERSHAEPMSVAPDEPTAEFEKVIDALGLRMFFDRLVKRGVMGVEQLREMEWDELKEIGMPVPLRSRVVDWQNDEVFVPRWSTGTFACTSDPWSCILTTLCPCYALNKVWREGEVKPNPCPLCGCLTYLVCLPFFPFVGCFARQHLSLKYGITPTYPQRDRETGRDARMDAIEDCCCHLCCHPCTLCQELREMKHHHAGRHGRTFTNRSAGSDVPPPPPGEPAGGTGRDATDGGAGALGPGSAADVPEGTRPPPTGGGHRAAMAAPAVTMQR